MRRHNYKCMCMQQSQKINRKNRQFHNYSGKFQKIYSDGFHREKTDYPKEQQQFGYVSDTSITTEAIYKRIISLKI